MNSSQDFQTENVGSDSFVLRGQCDEGKGMKFEAHLKAVPDGGQVNTTADGIQVQDANAVTLILSAASSYSGKDPESLCKEYLDAAANKYYTNLRNDHVSDYRKLFRRVELDLGKNEAARLPADERLRAIKQVGQYGQLQEWLAD